MNLKTLALILKGLRVSGSWSQSIGKKRKGALHERRGPLSMSLYALCPHTAPLVTSCMAQVFGTANSFGKASSPNSCRHSRAWQEAPLTARHRGNFRCSRAELSFPSGFRRESHHDVESGGQFADARAFDGREIHRHRRARLWVTDFLINAVALILRLAFDVTLRRPLLAPFHFDREVNVPCASRVEHGLDGAKIVFAAGAGQEPAKALEVFVALRVSVTTVQIDPMVVHLPDFHQRVPYRIAFRVEDAPAQVRDFPNRRSDAVVDDDEVVVCVERQVVRIEWPLRLSGRADEFVAKGAGHGE